MTSINFREQAVLTVQDRTNALFHSGCKMYTWTSNDQPIRNFSSIEFSNDYTASVSIKCKQSNDDQWHVLVKQYRIMESAHGEIGSNSRVVLNQKHFVFMPRTVYQLRFILRQPSPIWKDFSIGNVKLHQLNTTNKDRKISIERLLANTLINDDQIKESNNAKIPPIHELSQRLQDLWCICATMQQSDYGDQHVKRFDKGVH